MPIPKLRPYQQDSIDLIKSKFKEGKRVVLLVMSGGGGKTNIACHMMLESKNKGNHTLFIAHRKELIKQAQGRLKQFEIESGIIMSSEKEDLMKTVQVASIQTLQRRSLPPAKLVIVDEAHRSIGPQYMKILKEYQDKGSFIIGLTGTPFRTNKREGLNLLYQDFVSNITSSLLLEQGFLAPVKVYGSGKISSRGMKTMGGEFRESELMKAFDTDDAYKNLISNFEKYAKDKKTIVFCCSIKHSIKCTEIFINNGYLAKHIDGETPSKERDEIVAQFRSGQIQVLLNYGIAIEGLDVPLVECVVLALATKSKIKYLQASWRGSRPAPGKEFYTIIDMADNCERFGFPDEDIDVSLEAECETESSGVAPVKLCSCCSYMNHASAKSCNDCNTEFVKTKKEVDEEEFIELSRDRKHKKWAKYTQKDLHKIKDEDLEEFARVKKYKPSWVSFEKQRRKENKKFIKIKGYEGQDLYKKMKELEVAYYGKKAIDASQFVFSEETKTHVVFNYVKKQENESISN